MSISRACIRVSGKALVFRTKFEQAEGPIVQLAGTFRETPILVVSDSLFGNNGLLKSLSG